MKESMYLLTYETDKGSERYILKRASYVNGTKETIRKKGFQFVSVEKVYPINMERYGHDFDHVATMTLRDSHSRAEVARQSCGLTEKTIRERRKSSVFHRHQE